MRVQVTVGGVEEGRGERACRGGELKHVVGEVRGLGDREVDEVACRRLASVESVCEERVSDESV
eukprot:3545497-Rhodomonas_salina.1